PRYHARKPASPPETHPPLRLPTHRTLRPPPPNLASARCERWGRRSYRRGDEQFFTLTRARGHVGPRRRSGRYRVSLTGTGLSAGSASETPAVPVLPKNPPLHSRPHL